MIKNTLNLTDNDITITELRHRYVILMSFCAKFYLLD